MAILRFSFGTMGSGKSTLALQIHHNLSSRQLFGLLLTTLDREGNQVTSRLGVAAPAIDVTPDLDLYALAVRHWPIALPGVRRGAVLHRRAVRPTRPGRRRPRDRRVRVRAAHRLPRRAVRGHAADARDRRRARAAAGRGAVLVRRPGHAQRPRRQRRDGVRGRDGRRRRHQRTERAALRRHGALRTRLPLTTSAAGNLGG